MRAAVFLAGAVAFLAGAFFAAGFLFAPLLSLAPPPKGSNVIDLMAALKKSLGEKEAAGKAKKATARKSTAKKTATRKEPARKRA